MARIRTIKPEFWQDFQLAEQLTRDQRLFYIALWNEADDDGRFQAHPARLKGVVFPYDDDIHGDFIEDSLSTLSMCKKVVLYSVNGEPYGQLTNFNAHQRINRPTESRIPPPPKQLEKINEDSGSDQVELIEPSPPEGKGREGEQGKEREKSNVRFEREFDEFWKRYPLKVGKKAALKAYQARRREGIEQADILEGLKRYLAYKEAVDERLHNPATFLGPNHWFAEEWAVTEQQQQAKAKPNGKAKDEPILHEHFKGKWEPIITERPKKPDAEEAGPDPPKPKPKPKPEHPPTDRETQIRLLRERMKEAGA